VLGWNLWIRAHAWPARDFASLYYTNYLGHYFANISWRDLAPLVETNVASLLKAAGSFLFFDAPTLCCWIAAAAAIWGIARLSRENKTVGFSFLFAVFYSAMLIVWDFPPNERFLIPVFPLLAVGLCRAMDELLERRRPWASVAVAGIGLWWILCAWKGTSQELPRIFQVERERQEPYRAAFAALVKSCPAGEPVLAYQDTLVYLYTGRTALRPIVASKGFYRNDPAALWGIFRNIDDYARQHGASCLLSTAGDYHTDAVISDHAAMESIFAQNPRLRIVFQSDAARIYRVTR